jgi:hypothetical protein
MKIFKKLIVWMLIAIIVEVVSFGYIDKYYLVTETNFKVEKVEIKEETKAPTLKISLPSISDLEVKLNYNAKYGLYKNGESINIVNISTGELDEIKSDDNGTIHYFMWIPESYKIMYIKKNTIQKKFKLYTYDVKLKTQSTEVKNYTDGTEQGKEVTIPFVSALAEVKSMDISSINGMTYIQVNNNKYKDEIYKMDRMASLTQVSQNDIKTKAMGKMLITKRENNFVYEDLPNGKVYININSEGVKKPLTPNKEKNLLLLGIDPSNDTIYLGVNENDKITKIYYGNAETDVNKWTTVELPTPVIQKDIHVSTKSRLYINNSVNSTITDILNYTSTSYTGRLLDICDLGVISVNQDKLEKTLFNK